MASGDVFQNALTSVYDPAVLSFALACGFIALAICLLDWVGTLLLGRSSLLEVGFGGWRTFQSILLWESAPCWAHTSAVSCNCSTRRASTRES